MYLTNFAGKNQSLRTTNNYGKERFETGFGFSFFEEVCQVPRPSKKEEKIRAFLIGFAQERGLAYKTDEAGNLLIIKPATPGKENLKKVVLQSHMDMVCEKNKTTEHDLIQILSVLM